MKDLASPPSEAVMWLCKGPGPSVRVKARTWFEARDKAMRLLGCGPGEIEVRVSELRMMGANVVLWGKR